MGGKRCVYLFDIVSLRVEWLLRISISHVLHPVCQMLMLLIFLILKRLEIPIISIDPATVLKRTGSPCFQYDRTCVSTVIHDLLHLHAVFPVIAEIIAVGKPLRIFHVRIDQCLRRFLQLIIRIVIVLIQFFHPDSVILKFKGKEVISFPSHNLIE